MSDDQWRRSRGEPDPEFGDDEFGAVRFADDEDATEGLPMGSEEGNLSFGSNDTGPMPHWTSPPTGDVPRVKHDDDLDVWSTFSGRSDDEDPFMDDDLVQAGPSSREPARIQIDTDPTDEGSRPRPAGPPRTATRAGRPPTSRGPRPAGGAGRDMPTAIGMGLALGALFVALVVFGPAWMTMAFAVLVVGLGAVEFFDKTTERGYQPAAIIGIVAVAAGPLTGYLVGEGGVLLVVTFAFMGSSMVFIGSSGLQSGPLPNVAITNLGVVYLGLLGSFAGLILRYSTVDFGIPGKNIGTDTLMLVAVGVVASDVGALFVGSAAGKTPLRAWISPNKTVEGFIGGLVAAIVAVSLGSMISDTWNGQVNVLVLGVGIGILAPIGDLTESMFKRNLDIKDFGTIVKGHGGVLDRFDGFLFAMPFAYYALTTLQPWTYVK